MKTSDFDYNLPEELIAQFPSETRGGDRLLVAPLGGPIKDLMFKDIVGELGEGDLLVVNNTKVINARLYGSKETGGKIEMLLERVLDNNKALCQIKASNTPQDGMEIELDGGVTVTVLEKRDSMYLVQFPEDVSIFEVLEKNGHVPLPPYIARADKEMDLERYQTVYAKEEGAVAAPTAGLHFTDDILDELRFKGVGLAHITLHVGSGTYQPVRVENIDEHKMHSEWFQIPQSCVDMVNETKKAGGKIVAVGTTTMRALESAAKNGELARMSADTDIFIKPGFEFKIVDRLITNFHLPKSTLLMLVSAFSGTKRIKEIYEHAIKERYHFFSYGDAMLIDLDPEEAKRNA